MDKYPYFRKTNSATKRVFLENHVVRSCPGDVSLPLSKREMNCACAAGTATSLPTSQGYSAVPNASQNRPEQSLPPQYRMHYQTNDNQI